MSPTAEFDQYARTYDDLLNSALSTTGETKEYFAENRVRRLAHLLRARDHQCSRVMDFGCGTGSAIPVLKKYFASAELAGIDNSAESVKIAAESYGNDGVSFWNAAAPDRQPLGGFDLVVTNGVFHHIPVSERQQWLSWIRRQLRPGGMLAFFENNPWNPGTRYVMNRCEFDKDAVTLSVREAQSRIRNAGFTLVESEHMFFFPASLRRLRFMERYLRRLPFGGQYLCLALNP